MCDSKQNKGIESLPPTLKFANPYIFGTRWCKSLRLENQIFLTKTHYSIPSKTHYSVPSKSPKSKVNIFVTLKHIKYFLANEIKN